MYCSTLERVRFMPLSSLPGVARHGMCRLLFIESFFSVQGKDWVASILCGDVTHPRFIYSLTHPSNISRDQSAIPNETGPQSLLHLSSDSFLEDQLRRTSLLPSQPTCRQKDPLPHLPRPPSLGPSLLRLLTGPCKHPNSEP